MHRQVQPALTHAPQPAAGAGDGGRRRAGSLRLALVALLAVWLGALGWDLGSRPISTTAEQRCHDVMLGMLSSGDWVVPRRAGTVRLQKPPLAYWSAAATARLTGRADRFALRLPSVIASVGLLLLTFAWGRRARGPRAGLAAAAALMFMQSFFALSRRGVAEMELALACQVALYALLRLHAGGGGWRWRAVFAVGLAAGVLAKATVALLVIGLPAVVFLASQGAWRRALRPSVVLWVVAGLAAGLAWYGVVMLRVPGAWDTLRAQLVLPLGVEVEQELQTARHVRPLWAYLGLLLGAAAPAVLALPWVVRRAAASRCWRDAPAQRLAALTFGSLFVAFSLIPGKQKHYLLPLLPSLAVMIGTAGVELADAVPGWFGRRVRVAGLVAAALGLALLVPFGRALDREFGLSVLAWSAWGLGGAVLLAATAILAWRRRALALVVLLLVLDLGAQVVYARTWDVWRQGDGVPDDRARSGARDR